MAISLDGTAYDLLGTEGAPVVALIHGLGLTRGSTWNGLIPALAEDYRVIAYDLYGHGESAMPVTRPSLAVLAGQLRDLLDHLEVEQAALVGFSLGGMINRRFAIDNPDRATALVILNSPHERSSDQQELVEKRVADTSDGGQAATINATLERWFTTGFRRDHTDAVDQIRQVVLANDPTIYTAHQQVLATGVIELMRPDPPLRQPTLVMTCENDSGSTPAMSHEIAVEIEGAQVVVAPELQHLGLIERPDLFHDAITSFLRVSASKGITK